MILYLLLNILTAHYQDAQLVTHCVTQKNSKHKGAIDICFWSFLSNATLTVEIDMDLNPRNTRIWIRIRQQQKPGMSLKKKESGSKSMVLQHNKIHAFFLLFRYNEKSYDQTTWIWIHSPGTP